MLSFTRIAGDGRGGNASSDVAKSLRAPIRDRPVTGFRDVTSPTKEWEKLVVSAKLRHGGHPVLRWMASNVAVEIDAAGNLKPSKKKGTERIDGIVAGIMALGRALPTSEPRSVCDTRGSGISSISRHSHGSQ